MNEGRKLGSYALALLLAIGSAVPLAFADPDTPAPAPAKPAPAKPAPGKAPGDAGPVKELKMYAENWKWTPNTLRVAQGTKVRLEIENVDAPHAFQLKAYKLDVPLPQGKTTVVEFVADKAGEYKWRCSRPCGNGCPKMMGTLSVE